MKVDAGQADQPSSNNKPQIQNGAQKNRITENDQAILDIKGRQRKLKSYEKKLEQQEKEALDKIKELLKEGKKERAIIHLKKKKFAEAEMAKSNGAQIKLQEMIMGIESAQADLQIFEALKEGDAVLKDLQQKVSIADWEELYDAHAENMDTRQMEIDMFGEVLKDDDLEAELNQLAADDVAAELEGPSGAGAISAADAAQYREEHGISAPA